MYKEIDWDAMTIKNNFLFQETLRNKTLCKYLLEHVLHIQIKTIRYSETEKTMSAQLRSKNTRLDVYVEDNLGNVSDVEMQTTGSASVLYSDLDEETVARELPLRTRYYQNIIGTNMLRKGTHYRELKKTYVIFVCTFDPFGLSACVSLHLSLQGKQCAADGRLDGEHLPERKGCRQDRRCGTGRVFTLREWQKSDYCFYETA